jgi:hypothetical protein
MTCPSNSRSGPGRGGRSKAETALAGTRDASTVLGHPPGPCQCDDLLDRIDRPEPRCDVERRQIEAARRVAAVERRWRQWREIAAWWRYWGGA